MTPIPWICPLPLPGVLTVTSTGDMLTSLGETVQLTATLVDSEGRVVPNPTITWTTLDPAVVSVSATGLVTALSNGRADINARANGTTGSFRVQVTQQAASLTYSPASITFAAPGDTLRLTYTVFDAGGSEIEGHGLGAVGTANSAVATIDLSGLVTAVGSGMTTLSLQLPEPDISIPVTVN